jgi:hypothetical protein
MAILPAVSSSAMHGAVVPIATCNSSNGNTTFFNIPQTYQDLRLIISGSIASGTSYPFISFNNSSTTCSHTRLLGNGSSATSERRTGDGVWYWGEIPFLTGSTFVGSLVLDILNYSNSVTYKSGISRWAHDLNGSGQTQLTAHLNQITLPISRIDFGPNSSPFSTYSATLYGIRTVGQ